jgi:transcriptional regulator with XRE-family HTH domain
VPTPREQLSAAMRKARLEAGVATHAKMAQRLNMSRPAISKAESPTQAIPSDPLLAAWAKACRVPVEEFTEIVQRAKSGTPEWFGPWLGAEQQATRLRFWAPIVVPGLLQTEAYLLAIERSGDVVSQRLERQRQVIGRARITAVIDHRVLAHVIGSAQVMAEQCGHIASLVEREDVTLHVVPEGANIGLGGALALASNKSLVTVNMTTMTREITSTEAAMVEEAQAAFEMILGMALPPVPSLEYVKEREAAWKER